MVHTFLLSTRTADLGEIEIHNLLTDDWEHTDEYMVVVLENQYQFPIQYNGEEWEEKGIGITDRSKQLGWIIANQVE